MTDMERDFLNDIKEAVNEFNPEYEEYHYNGYFNVDITVSLNIWEKFGEEIWNRLSEVGDDWGVTPDSDTNEYYMSVESDREEDDDDDF